MTRPTSSYRWWWVWGVLLMATLACGVLPTSPAAEQTIPPPPSPTPLPTHTPEPTPEPVADQPTAVPQPTQSPVLTGDQREYLASATVFIAMLQRDSRGNLILIGTGSGTLISPDGLILTNAHVASPLSMGFGEDEPDVLGIGLVERADRPPVATYLAELVAVDGLLDLAVIRIATKLDGSPVNRANLQLPFVALGDSDHVRLGDSVNIFGFPGIGGETITFTRGSVAGFSSEDPIGDRAWVKTDATIAGGNSGGLAANEAGEIIGIPTRASAGTNEQITDCRVVQDTNGDGRLTAEDTCIPIGGFINALRPVKLALPLIRAAQADLAYESPFAPPSASTAASAVPSFALVTWAEDFEANGCARGSLTNYELDAPQLVAVFSYNDVAEGTSLAIYWLRDGVNVGEQTLIWDGPTDGRCFALWYRPEGVVPAGVYTVLVYVGASKNRPLAAEASVAVGTAVAEGGVVVSGRITDADTGRGIPSASLILLKPGIDVDRWLLNPTSEAIYTFATANSRGEYVLPLPLQRGVRYGGVAFADGYNEEVGYLEYASHTADRTTVNLQLTR